MMFRSYNNISEYFFKDYVAIAMAILRLATTTCYFHVCIILLFSWVKISCLLPQAHLVFHWCLFRVTSCLWKRVFVQNLCYENEFINNENEPVGGTHFNMNGFPLVLTERQKENRKWPIDMISELSIRISWVNFGNEWRHLYWHSCVQLGRCSPKK